MIQFQENTQTNRGMDKRMKGWTYFIGPFPRVPIITTAINWPLKYMRLSKIFGLAKNYCIKTSKLKIDRRTDRLYFIGPSRLPAGSKNLILFRNIAHLLFLCTLGMAGHVLPQPTKMVRLITIPMNATLYTKSLRQ